MNVVSVKGGKVHSMMPGFEGDPYPLCRGGGMNNSNTKFRTTDAPLSCKTCLTYAERREIAAAEVSQGESESMAKTDTKADAPTNERLSDEIDGNIERIKSLAEAGDAEAVEELQGDTETLISKLSGKGSIKLKTGYRERLREAATVQEAPKGAEVAERSYEQFAGVPELITVGAEKVAEGARLNIKTSDTAREIAMIGLSMWRKMPNSEGNPDLLGDSNNAKKASKALKEAAGEALAREGLDAFDVERAVRALWRSVQYHRTDVRAVFLRSLDEDTEEAAEDRETFAAILKDKPENVPASVWIADHYKVSLKGEIEKARERYHANKELASGDSGSGDDGDGDEAKKIETSPDEKVSAVVNALMSNFREANPDDFEHASEATKKAIRAQLEEAAQALKAMIAATAI